MKEAEFQRFAAQGFNRVPLVAETFADLDTPLSLYLKLANRSNTYLLESVEGGERFGRYSFIGLAARPVKLRAVGSGLVTVMHGRDVEKSQSADPLEFVCEYLSRYRVAEFPGLPRFCGGLVGYFGYDAVRWMEPRLGVAEEPGAIGCPDMLLLVSEELAVIDNLSGKLYLVVYADPKPQARGTTRKRVCASCAP